MDTLDSDYSDDGFVGYLTGKACPHAPPINNILYACNINEMMNVKVWLREEHWRGQVEEGALEGWRKHHSQGMERRGRGPPWTGSREEALGGGGATWRGGGGVIG